MCCLDCSASSKKSRILNAVSLASFADASADSTFFWDLYTCLTQPEKYASVSKSKETPRVTEF
jgi:hypothetical protein